MKNEVVATSWYRMGTEQGHADPYGVLEIADDKYRNWNWS